MSPFDLILIVLVAAAAFAAGYFIGRFQALAERGVAPGREFNSPLPGPEDREYREPSAAPSRPRGAAPPASAGSGTRTPPRRSTTPPPAAAGLMGRGTSEKPGDSQK